MAWHKSKYFLLLLSVTVSILITFYLIICFSIAVSIDSISTEAIKEYGGDKIAALAKYVDDKNNTLQKRNSAVWALGQIGGKRAIPLLKKHYSGDKCNHKSTLCQHELKKAIDGCNGKFNAAGWMMHTGYFCNSK